MGVKWNRTEEQQAYLDIMLPQYCEAQGNGKGPGFILFVIEEWFRRWPEGDKTGPSDLPLTEEEKAQRKGLVASAVAKRRKQIGNYLQWHVDKLKVSGGRVSRAKSDPLAKILKMAAKRRKKQPAQVFAQLFKDRVNERLLPILPSLNCATPVDAKAHQAQRFSARTKLIYKMWQEADEETRKTVYAAKERLDRQDNKTTEGQESKESSAADVPGTGDSITRAEMQKNIDSLGKVVISVIKELAKKTGWSFTVLMGGINEQGIADIASVNVGATPMTGLNFAEYTVDFDTKILQPFREFLSAVYPPELRQAFAIEYALKIAKSANKSVDKMEGTAMDTNPDRTEMTAFAPSSSIIPSSPSLTVASLNPVASGIDFSGIDFDAMNLDPSFGFIDASMNLDPAFGSIDASMNLEPSFGSIGASHNNDFSIFDRFMAATVPTEGENDFRFFQLGGVEASNDVVMSSSLGSTYQPPSLTASFPDERVVISSSDNIGLLSNGTPTFPSGSGPQVPPSFDTLFYGPPAFPDGELAPMMAVSAASNVNARGEAIEDPSPTTVDSVPIVPTKKPRKKMKARSKKVVGRIANEVTGLGEVEGESNSSNVNASGRPIRERKKKEPMGAAYEREVEKWANLKGRK